jgi:hypothetical protein
LQVKTVSSAEENRVLRECNRESFWYRSLPLGAILASLTHVAILRGILKPSLRFGSGPKGGRDHRNLFVMVSVFLIVVFRIRIRIEDRW